MCQQGKLQLYQNNGQSELTLTKEGEKNTDQTACFFVILGNSGSRYIHKYQDLSKLHIGYTSVPNGKETIVGCSGEQ